MAPCAHGGYRRHDGLDHLWCRQAQAPVIDLMEQQRTVRRKGGTMRLGAYPCALVPETKAHACYGDAEISERHRHRYEFNNGYRERLAAAGLVFSGLSPDGELVEVVEYPAHPWFVACQFHPEFQSTPLEPSPLFRDFVAASLRQADAAEPRIIIPPHHMVGFQ